MAKVALDDTINMQGTKEIDRTNLAQLREPTTNERDDCGRTVTSVKKLKLIPAVILQ